MPMQPDARAALEEQLQEEGKLWKQNPQRLRDVLAEGFGAGDDSSVADPARAALHLRHALASSRRRHLQAIKDLGHSSVAVTEAHYAHLPEGGFGGCEPACEIPVAPRGTGTVSQMPPRK